MWARRTPDFAGSLWWSVLISQEFLHLFSTLTWCVSHPVAAKVSTLA